MLNNQQEQGSVVALYRYPVKSMMGEELNATDINQRGLSGDRVYALVDSTTGKAGSAKNPRKWPTLFDFRAAFTVTPQNGASIPPVRITLPDGTMITNEQQDCNDALSRALQREVTLENTGFMQEAAISAENFQPDLEDSGHVNTITDFTLPEGTFFDGAVVHLLTTASLGQLNTFYPEGRFEARRFRPNIVVQSGTGQKGFIENEWIGHTLAIGDEVRLSITRPCPRCIMTTLAQGDLPADLGILRTAAKTNKANVGVYASVLQGGRIKRGDKIKVE